MWMTIRTIRFAIWVMLVGGVVIIFALAIGQLLPPAPMLVYVHQTNEEVGNLYLLDIDRQLSLPLTNTETQYSDPTWSPNGDKLLFVMGGRFNPRGGYFTATRIVELNLRTKTRFALTNNRQPVNENTPSWSVTGKIAYAAYNNGWDIVIIRPENVRTALITQTAQMTLNTLNSEHSPQWSPDGSQLAYLIGGQFFGELAVADANGANSRVLTSGMRVYQGQYDWSPTGTHIVFTAERDGNREIYLVNVSNGATTNLSRHIAHDSAPQWSPDGTQIAFISERSNFPTEIFVMSPDGSNVRQLTTSYRYLTQPVWSPDGAWIAYSADSGNSSFMMQIERDIFIVSAQGGEPRRLTFTISDDFEPVWKP